MSIRNLGPLNSGGAGYGAQSHGGPKAVLPDEEVRIRPSATPADLMAEALPFPDQSPDILRNVASSRTGKNLTPAAPREVGVTFYYDAGPHLALENVRLQVLTTGGSEDVEEHVMRPMPGGGFTARAQFNTKQGRVYCWRVLANVRGGDVRGNPQVLHDERITFGNADPQFSLQQSGSTVRYSITSYQRLGTVLDEAGQLTIRLVAREAGRVAFKYWDAKGQEQWVPLHREALGTAVARANTAAGPGKAPPPQLAEVPATWSTRLPREASAAVVNRPYLFVIDDREVTDPYARAVCARPGAEAETQRVGRVMASRYAFEHDATPRETDARVWLTCRVDPSQRPAAGDRPPLEGLKESLQALRELGITTVELDNVAPRDVVGQRIQRNLAIDDAHGTRQDLQAFVDAAHGLGLNVVLSARYDANAADRPADAEFIRNHAVYQLDAFHADGLRVAVSCENAAGDGDGEDTQLAEIARQLGCLHTHVVSDDADAPRNAVQDALHRGELTRLQEALGVRSTSKAPGGVGAPAQPHSKVIMTPGQARMAVALGLLTPTDAGFSDSFDLGGVSWTPLDYGKAARNWQAIAGDASLEEFSFGPSYRQQFERLMGMTAQARSVDPFFRALSLTDRLVFALLAAMHPDARRRAMNDLTLRHMDQFTYDMIRLRRRWRGLFTDSELQVKSLCEHPDTGVSVTRHGAAVVLIVNTSDQDRDSYSVPLPAGRWRRVLHSQARRYGGKEPNDVPPPMTGGTSHPLRLPAHSVQIFEAVDA